MYNLIKKWWNREWSNWEHSHYVDSYDPDYPSGNPTKRHDILVSKSNDGLIRYKQVKVW